MRNLSIYPRSRVLDVSLELMMMVVLFGKEAEMEKVRSKGEEGGRGGKEREPGECGRNG